ncbi:MAG: hypothetical protein LBB77_09945 [Treponema sp.]|jgi:hypothetical protein|nr:hypothetical protein [Treponema sp.]
MIFAFRPCQKFLGSVLFFVALGAGIGQETSLEELLPELKERAVVLDIISRVVEENQQVVWNSVTSKVTIPGRPVGIKIVGANVVMALQFTPFFRRGGNSVLVVQGQIWVDIPGEGMRYQTTLQTMPIEFGEPLFFFPLGSPSSPQETRIELQLEIRPYTEEFRGQEAQRNRANRRAESAPGLPSSAPDE